MIDDGIFLKLLYKRVTFSLVLKYISVDTWFLLAISMHGLTFEKSELFKKQILNLWM